MNYSLGTECGTQSHFGLFANVAWNNGPQQQQNGRETNLRNFVFGIAQNVVVFVQLVDAIGFGRTHFG